MTQCQIKKTVPHEQAVIIKSIVQATRTNMKTLSELARKEASSPLTIKEKNSLMNSLNARMNSSRSRGENWMFHDEVDFGKPSPDPTVKPANNFLFPSASRFAAHNDIQFLCQKGSSWPPRCLGYLLGPVFSG